MAQDDNNKPEKDQPQDTPQEPQTPETPADAPADDPTPSDAPSDQPADDQVSDGDPASAPAQTADPDEAREAAANPQPESAPVPEGVLREQEQPVRSAQPVQVGTKKVQVPSHPNVGLRADAEEVVLKESVSKSDILDDYNRGKPIDQIATETGLEKQLVVNIVTEAYPPADEELSTVVPTA